MKVATKKRKWTIEEWADIARRCQEAKERLSAAADAPARIPGSSVVMIDALLDAYRYVEYALITLETPLEQDHDISPIRFLQGEPHMGPCQREPHLPEGPYRRKGILPRWAWTLEGRRLKTIAEDLAQLAGEVSNGLGKTRAKRPYSRLNMAVRRLLKARSHLDSLVHKQHPDWHHASHVFFGAEFKPVQFLPDGTIDFSDITAEELGGAS